VKPSDSAESVYHVASSIAQSSAIVAPNYPAGSPGPDGYVILTVWAVSTTTCSTDGRGLFPPIF